jgi:hypothetical protein
MSSITVDQFIFNYAPNATASGPIFTIHGFGTIGGIECECIQTTSTYLFVINKNVCRYLNVPESNVNLTLTLNCPEPTDCSTRSARFAPNDDFFTIGSDNPLIEQLGIGRAIHNSKRDVTVRLPVSKIVKATAGSVEFKKCVDYFSCDEYCFEVRFPELSYTEAFEFSIEIISCSSDSTICDMGVEILATNCSGNIKSGITLNKTGEMICIPNDVPLKCVFREICFYGFGMIIVIDRGEKVWKYVKDIKKGDVMVTYYSNKEFKVNRVFKMPQYKPVEFVKFGKNCVQDGMPLADAFLTKEHMVKTPLGIANSDYYAKTFKSKNIKHTMLYTDHVYTFEVNTPQTGIYVNYNGLPSRVWSLNEKSELKEQLLKFR